MSARVGWIAAEAEKVNRIENVELLRWHRKEEIPIGELRAHTFPGKKVTREIADEGVIDDLRDQRRIYRSRTVTMLRRYMRYSIETGRLPSLVGREFFRSKVTSYRVTTFEDRVIFVHDMETCLRKLDDFSREVLARVVLQEYGHEEAARLLGCARMTVHRRLVEALDELGGILLDVGLLTRLCSEDKEPCQAGKEAELLLNDCEEEE
jgi:hypothetical protein